ncbi:MAG TPA: preprotein translocase subunit YajC [Actinomycetota bacterium]
MVASLVHLAASGTSSGGGSATVGLLIPLVLMGGIFYFLLIRPQQRQRRAQRDLIESLDIGDEVVTIGGLYGTIREVDDESVTLEVAQGVDLRFVRGAIARKLVYDEGGYEDQGQDEEEEEEAGDQS